MLQAIEFTKLDPLHDYFQRFAEATAAGVL